MKRECFFDIRKALNLRPFCNLIRTNCLSFIMFYKWKLLHLSLSLYTGTVQILLTGRQMGKRHVLLVLIIFFWHFSMWLFHLLFQGGRKRRAGEDIYLFFYGLLVLKRATDARTNILSRISHSFFFSVFIHMLFKSFFLVSLLYLPWSGPSCHCRVFSLH